MDTADKTGPTAGPVPETAVDFELSALVRTLEMRFPGFTLHWIANLQEEAAADEVIRLRGPRKSAEVLREQASAVARAAQIRLINIALERESGSWEPPGPEPEAKSGRRKDKRR